jgi:hypothetical protein
LSEVARLPAKKPKKSSLNAFCTANPSRPNISRRLHSRRVRRGSRAAFQQFFADFEDFADVVNWWLAAPHVGGPWRLQELPDAELSLDVSDSPPHGRRYAILRQRRSPLGRYGRRGSQLGQELGRFMGQPSGRFPDPFAAFLERAGEPRHRGQAELGG